MGRRGFGGILSAIMREAARAQRQAEASRKRQLQAQARQVRESLRAARQLRIATERTAHQQERAGRQQYLEDRLAETADRNEKLQTRIEELRSILTHTLSVNDTIHFEDLPIKEPTPVFSPPFELLIPKPAPQKRALLSAVRVPGKVSQLLPWVKSRYERELAAAEARYEEVLQDHREEESQRQNRLASLKANYERTKQAFEQKVKQRDLEVGELEAAYRAGNPDAVVTYNTMVLERSEYPEGFPQEFQVAYVPESKQLVIEYELPTPEVVPAVAEYRYVKARDDVEEKPRKPAEIKDLYQDIVAAVSLRTLHEVFEADQSNHLTVVVFNGLVQAIDPATGREIRPHLISARATKDSFLELNLARVDKRTCLRNLGAQVSPQPTELVAVRPIVDFNMVDKRFVEGKALIDSLDSRPNLMDLNPYEFEQLVCDLFMKNGLETKLTRSSRDGGVDVVAFDKRPVLGGKVVIQAKRYRNTVHVAAVRDLYGTMMNEGANKGILVATSGYGKDAFEFANDKPIELIDGGGLLYLLEQVGVQARIVMPVEN